MVSSPGALVTLGALMQSATYPDFLTALNSTTSGSQTLANLLATAKNSPSPFFAPQQLHLSHSSSPPTLSLTWVTTTPLPPSCTPTLSYWALDTPTNVLTSPASQYTYSAGVAGWHGALYTATTTATPLLPGVQYQYSVGGGGAYNASGGGGGGACGPFSQPRTTTLPPPPGAPTAYLAIAADMGTIVPLGWAVADRLIQDHFESGHPFDAMVLAGDLAYATVSPGSCSPTNPGCDEVEWTWDAFGLQLEPLSSSIPQYNSVGNHEGVPGNITTTTTTSGSSNTTTRPSRFAAFEARYPQPTSGYGGSPPFWWAVDVGPVHLQFISTEHPFGEGSPQWEWIQGDLAGRGGRSSSTTTPWVVTVMHRPIYSAAVLEWEDHSPGGKLSTALEPLLKGRSDLVVSGHIHSLDRTHPVFNGTITSRPLPNTTVDTYASPTSPIYLCQGTSGALPENVFFDPPPAWSAARILGSFGYGRLAATPHELKYEFVGMVGTVLDSFTIQK